MRAQHVRKGTAAVITVAPGHMLAVVEPPIIPDGNVVTGVEGLYLDPGRYIVVPIKTWEQTVRKAMIDPAEAPAEPELEVNAELPPTRQQRRAKLRN